MANKRAERGPAVVKPTARRQRRGTRPEGAVASYGSITRARGREWDSRMASNFGDLQLGKKIKEHAYLPDRG